MRRDELAGLQPRAVLAAEPGDAVALGVEDGSRGPRLGTLRLTGMPGPNSPMMKSAACRRSGTSAGPVHVVPLRLVFAVAVEDLDPVVLAVRDIDPAVGIAGDVMGDVELAGIGAGLAPGFSSLPSGEYLWTQALP